MADFNACIISAYKIGEGIEGAVQSAGDIRDLIKSRGKAGLLDQVSDVIVKNTVRDVERIRMLILGLQDCPGTGNLKIDDVWNGITDTIERLKKDPNEIINWYDLEDALDNVADKFEKALGVTQGRM